MWTPLLSARVPYTNAFPWIPRPVSQTKILEYSVSHEPQTFVSPTKLINTAAEMGCSVRDIDQFYFSRKH